MENISDNSSMNATENASNDIYSLYDIYSFVLPDPYNTIVVALHWIILPMIFASVFGNIMIILIMCMPKNRNASTSVFFIALAVADMFLMVFIATERWLFSVWGTHLSGISQAMARIRGIVENSAVQISSWILAIITLERVVCLILPHRFKSMCTARLASLVVGVVCGLVAVFNIICFTVLMDVGYGEDNEDLLWFGDFVLFSWLDFVFGFMFPFLIVVVGTIIIIYKLFHLKGSDLKSNRVSISQCLVSVNVVFLITMSPFRLYYFVYPSPEEQLDVNAQLFHEIVVTLADLNSTLNFYIYVLARKRFREDLKQLLCICKLKNIR